MITTSHGTQIEVDADGYVTLVRGEDDFVCPGRITGGGLEPVPAEDWLLSPETLRAIADLIEQQ